MATWILINTITIGAGKILPGHTIDDAQISVATVKAAGGQLWPSGDPVVAAAAIATLAAHTSKGIGEAEMESRMRAATGANSAQSSNFYLTQTTWNIDPANSSGLASDTNDGLTATTPLLTYAEFTRRIPDWGGLNHAVAINIMSDGVASDAWMICGDMGPSGQLLFAGTRTVAKSGTLSAVTNLNRASNVQVQLTDSVGASWAAYVQGGYYVRITSGANAGIQAPILKDLGAGVVRVGTFIQASLADNIDPGIANFDHYTLAGTETYQVVRGSKVPLFIGDADHTNLSIAPSVRFTDCMFLNNNTTSPTARVQIDGSAWWLFVNCVFSYGRFAGTSYSFMGCTFGATPLASNGASVYFRHCDWVYVYGGALVSVGTISQMLANECGQIFLDYDFAAQGNTIVYSQSGTIINVGWSSVWDNARNGYLWVEPNGVLKFYFAGIFYGNGNTGTLVLVEPWGQAQYATQSGAYTFAATGTGGSYHDFSLNGLTSVSVIRSDTGAFAGPIVCSFTNLLATYGGGGFGGNAVDIASGTGFVKTAFDT